MKRALLVLAAALASTSAFATTRLPIDPLGLNKTVSTASTKNVISIGTAFLNDFKAAQVEAGPSTSPVDPVGYACYTVGVNNLSGFAQQSPDGIISTGEAIYLLVQTQNVLASDHNCQAVCGRVQMLAGKIGGLLGALAVPNVCGALSTLAE